MNCQKCGRQLLETEKFCVQCGTPAEAVPEPEPTQSAEVRCDSCGETLTADDRFCQACGAQVGGPAITEHPSREASGPEQAESEGVDDPGSPPAATPPIPNTSPQGGSRSMLYPLLGLTFVLIACTYFAYDYFSTPRDPNLDASEESVELAQEEIAPLPDRVADRTQDQAPPDEAAPPVTDQPSGATPQGPAPRKSPASGAPSASGTPGQNTSPDTSQQVAAGRLGGYRPPPASPAVAPSTAPVQETSPDTSQEEAAGRLGRTTPPAVSTPRAASPSRKTSGGEVLMPGGRPARRPAQPRAPTQPVQPPPSQPAPKVAPQEGTIYWTGKLQKNQVIVIENGEASVGIADGDYFTGIPIDVHLPSPAVRLVERPTAENNWKRVAFRCLRTTKQSVTINIQWNLLR